MSPRTGKRHLTRFVLPSALLAFVVAAAASGSVLVAQEAPRRINFERDSSTAEVSARLSGGSDRHEYIFFSRTGRTLDLQVTSGEVGFTLRALDGTPIGPTEGGWRPGQLSGGMVLVLPHKGDYIIGIAPLRRAGRSGALPYALRLSLTVERPEQPARDDVDDESAAPPRPVPPGGADGGGAAAGAAASTPYERAYNNLMALKSFHFVFTAERQPNQYGGPQRLRAEGDYDARSRAWRYTLSTSAESEELDGDWVKINSTGATYHLMSGGWRQQGLSIIDSTDGSIEVMRKAMAPARPDLGRNDPPPTVGTDTVEGQECTRYGFTVPAGRALGGAFEACLNSRGDFVRLDSLDTVYRYRVVLSRHNQAVRITAPR